jgi:hypothetical protein
LQSMDSPRTVHGRHRLGKVRLNNVNVTKEEREEGDRRKYGGCAFKVRY